MVLAINIVGTVAVYLAYRPEKPLASRAASRRQILRDFDYVGVAGIIVSRAQYLVIKIKSLTKRCQGWSDFAPSGYHLGPSIRSQKRHVHRTIRGRVCAYHRTGLL